MTKLYVGNLSYGMTNESLLQLFSEKGYKAVSARIITDRETGRSRGFGFVELGPGIDATRAIGEFNGLNVDGRALMVNVARQESGGGGARHGGGGGFSGGRGGLVAVVAAGATSCSLGPRFCACTFRANAEIRKYRSET